MCPRCTILLKADFDPFVQWDAAGRSQFANSLPSHGRFRDRVWPVFRRPRRRVRRRRPRDVMDTPCGEKVSRSIVKSSRVASARRWIPMNPLAAHQMKVEDAFLRGWRKPG
jgi:hypothetical protein